MVRAGGPHEVLTCPPIYSPVYLVAIIYGIEIVYSCYNLWQ
jgi:hypothetical protein